MPNLEDIYPIAGPDIDQVETVKASMTKMMNDHDFNEEGVILPIRKHVNETASNYDNKNIKL